MKIDINEPVKYVGPEKVNIDYHHGQLPPAVGVTSVQVLRCNRKNPEESESPGWTYNHSPMLAYRNNKFYLEYLSTPVGEHVPPGRTLLTTSQDGLNWETPRIIFPQYQVPDGLFTYDDEKLPDGTFAVMHQRMGFYEASNGKFLVLGNYGISPHEDQVPFGRFSIGRVVREIGPLDQLGPIHFIRYNVETIWNENNTHYPLYENSNDEGFVDACEELLANPLVTQQWAEEQGSEDDLITVKAKDGGAHYNKAFCWYRLKDDTVIGLWKWMKAAVTHDDGRTWSDAVDIPTVRHAGAKIWGQRTADGRYALVYNPHTNNSCRWPLAVVTGDDGQTFDEMMTVIGDLPRRRYTGGPFKGFGFHYVRGLETHEGRSPDDAMYVVYSVNKEDIWLSRVSVPVATKVEDDVHDDFSDHPANTWVQCWNIHSPKWAPVGVTADPKGDGNCLKLSDFDPCEYAKAERVFAAGTRVSATARILAGQKDRGNLYIELWDDTGRIPVRILLDDSGWITIIHGRRRPKCLEYETNRWYDLRIVADARRSSFDVEVDGVSLSQGQSYQGQTTSMKGWFFLGPAARFTRMVFRTGPVRRTPTVDDWWSDFDDLPGADEKIEPVEFYIKKVDIESES